MWEALTGNKQKREAEERRQNALIFRDENVKKRVRQLRAFELGSSVLGYFDGLDTTDVTKLRIVVFGHTGTGKSSFINTVERVLRRADRGTCFPRPWGGEGEWILEEYLTDYFFRLVDTRGFGSYNAEELAEFFKILQGYIRNGELVRRNATSPAPVDARRHIPFSERVHACIIIVSPEDPRLKNDVLATNMAIFRKYLKENGITIITLVTHEDKIVQKEKDVVLTAASRATGSPANQTFFITNYTEDGCARNLRTEEQVLEVLEYTLTAAERHVKIAKQRELYKQQELEQVRQQVQQTILSQPNSNSVPQHHSSPPQAHNATPFRTASTPTMHTRSTSPSRTTSEPYIPARGNANNNNVAPVPNSTFQAKNTRVLSPLYLSAPPSLPDSADSSSSSITSSRNKRFTRDQTTFAFDNSEQGPPSVASAQPPTNQALLKDNLNLVVEPAPIPRPTKENICVDIESTMTIHNKMQVRFITNVNSTCGELMVLIKRRFKLGDLDDYFFSDSPEGTVILGTNSKVAEVLDRTFTLYLHSYDELN